MNAFFGIGVSSITISGGENIVPIDQWALLVEKTHLNTSLKENLDKEYKKIRMINLPDYQINQ
jgi:hypothetical protein